MKTLRISLLLTIVAIAFSSCSKEHLEGSGHIVTVDRNLSNFDKVLINSVVKTNISHGADFHVSVRTDAVAVSKVITYISNNTLIIDLDDNVNYQHITFEVDVEMPDISRLEHRGVSNARLVGFNDLDDLEVVHDGVGNLNLIGSAEQLHIDHDGVGDLNAFSFVSDTCATYLSGVGDINVTVLDHLQGHLSGVGNIHFQGSPSLEVVDTGVGNVIHID